MRPVIVALLSAVLATPATAQTPAAEKWMFGETDSGGVIGWDVASLKHNNGESSIDRFVYFSTPIAHGPATVQSMAQSLTFQCANGKFRITDGLLFGVDGMLAGLINADPDWSVVAQGSPENLLQSVACLDAMFDGLETANSLTEALALAKAMLAP